MTRLLKGKDLIIASHNPGKVSEIAELIKPFGLRAISADSLGLEEPPETGITFQENAELKAKIASKSSGKPALADDSGLCINLLGGDPGIYSARWAGPTKDFSIAMGRVKKAIIDSGQNPGGQSAKFVCALSLCWDDGYYETFTGEINGELTFPPRGALGFGYDPIFVPKGFDITFGEMEPKKKHDMSHRAKAFRQLIDNCLNND